MMRRRPERTEAMMITARGPGDAGPLKAAEEVVDDVVGAGKSSEDVDDDGVSGRMLVGRGD